MPPRWRRYVSAAEKAAAEPWDPAAVEYRQSNGQGVVGGSARGSPGNKTGISFRFRVMDLAGARSIKDSDCGPTTADRAAPPGAVAPRLVRGGFCELPRLQRCNFPALAGAKKARFHFPYSGPVKWTKIVILQNESPYVIENKQQAMDKFCHILGLADNKPPRGLALML